MPAAGILWIAGSSMNPSDFLLRFRFIRPGRIRPILPSPDWYPAPPPAPPRAWTGARVAAACLLGAVAFGVGVGLAWKSPTGAGSRPVAGVAKPGAAR